MRVISTLGIGRLIGMLPPNRRASDMVLRQIGHGASLDAGRIPDSFKDWSLALQRHTDTMVHETAMIASMGSLSGFDESLTIPDDVLAKVAAPTFFLWGEDDTFGGVDTARRVVSAMPDAELEMLPAAGHLPWLDDPDHAASVVIAHLLGRPGRSPRAGARQGATLVPWPWPGRPAGPVSRGPTGGSRRDRRWRAG